MAPGDATLDELIGSVTRGVYVTRFHYVNVEDPIPVLLTGMTRDGTFLIENGTLARPLKNLRFTQSAVEALASCEGVTRERKFVGTEEGAVYAPGLLLGEVRVHGADLVGPHDAAAWPPGSANPRTQHEPRRSSHAGARCLEAATAEEGRPEAMGSLPQRGPFARRLTVFIGSSGHRLRPLPATS